MTACTIGESALDARAALAALAEAAKLLEQIARRAADWQPQPHVALRAYPNGATFLLRHRYGIHLCRLIGNMPADQSWKAHRMTDGKIIRLENLKRAEFIALAPMPDKEAKS